MKDPIPVLIPLLNPNEPEALLVSLAIQEGQHVIRGELLGTLETTKSTADFTSPADGFIAGLVFSQGQSAHAGERLCYLAEDPAWVPPEPANAGKESAIGELGEIPPGLRITQPALVLVRQHNLDLSKLPAEKLVTESQVRALISSAATREEPSGKLVLTAPTSAFDPMAVIVYGGGGHGKSLIDLIRSLNVYTIIGVVDDGLVPGTSILGIPVLGGEAELPELHARGVRLAVNAVGGIGNIAVRVKVFQLLAEAGFSCPAFVHPTAFIEASASLSAGVQVFPHAYVGSETQVGFGAIVNTGAIVSHDCVLEDYVNISPGAMLAGEVHVGAATLVGMGATINLGVKIGSATRIGNGATVKSDVPTGGVVRAGSTWPA